MTKREKNTILQFIINIFTVSTSTLLPFLVRTVLVHYIGIDYLGVNSLFNSILQVLNVADFGLTTALAFYLYKPVEENDIQTINTYMGFFRRIFHIVGFLILLAGIIILPILPIFVKGKQYPLGLNIYVVYMAYILQMSLSYFANIYISTLMHAYLKSYINSIITGMSFLLMYGTQIIILICFRNYYFFSYALLISVVIQICAYTIIKKIYFPWLDYRGKPSLGFINDFKKRLIAMLLSKIRIVSRNAFDSLIISLFFGLTTLAEYQNYYQIILFPGMISVMIRQAIQPALGNGIATESMESNYGILKQYLFVYNFITTICMSCLLSLMQPFMELWMGQEHLLGMDIVVSVSIYYYLLVMSESTIMLREVTGIWEEGIWISVVEAILNIILNIIFARLLGLWGIVLATILTIAFINLPLENYYIFKGYFKNMYKNYMIRIIIYTVITIFISSITYFICIRINIVDYKMMFLRFFLSIIISSIIFLLIHIKDKEMKSTIIFIKTALELFKH